MTGQALAHDGSAGRWRPAGPVRAVRRRRPEVRGRGRPPTAEPLDFEALEPESTLIHRYQLGRLPFTLAGESAFAAALDREFAPCATAADGSPVPLRIEVVERLTPFAETVAMAPVTVAADGFQFAAGKVRYQVRRDAEGLRIDVAVPSAGLRELAPPALQRFAHFNYLSHAERRVKMFVYDIFDYAAQVAQLPLGQTFVHASSLTRDRQTIALLAWGGIGKTTSMLKLVLEDGWRFLSDDLGVVDEAGVAHRSPKHMQVYGYNLRGQPRIHEAFFGERGLADRVSWAIFRALKGDQRVRRRLSAESMFGADRVARAAPLTQAIFLERHSGSDFRWSEVPAAALVDRCAAILLREIDPFALVTNAVHGGGNSGTLFTLGEVEERTRAILRAAFSRVPCAVLSIPRGAAPDALVAYLKPRIV